MTNEEKILKMLEAMQTDMAGMKTDIISMKADISGMQTDMAGMKADISGMQTDMAGMKSDISKIKEVQAEHTAALNALIEWADECRNADRFPLPKLM